MKQPAASPGRAEKPQQLPAPPGLARLLLSKSRRGARSGRAPATSPMFVSRPGRSRGAGAADGGGEPSSPKVTCIGQVRMRKNKGKKKKIGAPAPEKTKVSARGYCRCLKKAFLCGGLFGAYFDDHRRRGGDKAAPEPVERGRRSPWVFSSRDVAVAAAPKQQPDPSRDGAAEEEEEESQMGVFGSVERYEKDQPGIDGHDKEGGEEEKSAAAEEDALASSSAAPPKNALLLMRCRSAPQNRSSPLTARFAAAPSPTQDAAPARASPSPAPSPRKAAAVGRVDDTWQDLEAVPAAGKQEEEEEVRGEEHEEEDEEEEEEMRCSSARPLVLPRCKSEPATTAAAKMAAGTDPEATPSGCFWANGGGSGRRRHAPPTLAAPVALTGH